MLAKLFRTEMGRQFLTSAAPPLLNTGHTLKHFHILGKLAVVTSRLNINVNEATNNILPSRMRKLGIPSGAAVTLFFNLLMAASTSDSLFFCNIYVTRRTQFTTLNTMTPTVNVNTVAVRYKTFLWIIKQLHRQT